ncbi:MAG: hypothetical protein CMI53_03165 [Parcubacteria group bacterium]|jgi:hypothetical protein|nr:hypothetical protein [Parcubacteria group bacterium]|tara:strand:+ start:5780 stop:6010 length:231 start_codon:yes stop_codon:yes gene_type:complete
MAKWPKFGFSGQVGEVIDTEEEWQELVVAKCDKKVEALKKAKQNPSITEYPEFGFYEEHTGDLTLGEWAEQQGIEL